MSTCPFAGLAWDDISVAFDFYAHYGGSYAASVGRRQHLAVDLVVKGAPDGGIGWPLVACESGRLVRLPSVFGGPHQLAIETDTDVFVYTHMQSSPPVQWPDAIAEGDPIGTLGREGFSYLEPGHLHFMRWSKADCRFIDPAPYLARACGGSPPVLSGLPALSEALDYVREHPWAAAAGLIAGGVVALARNR